MTTKARSVALQATTLAGVVALLGFFYINLQTNIDRLGLGSGVGFLSNPAGFDLSFSLTNYDASATYAAAFWAGFVNTVIASVLGIIGATAIGIVVGVARWSRAPVISDLATFYVEIFRNVPLLLQLFFWYFVVLRSLPAAREASSLGDVVFLSNRGLYFPEPVFSGVSWGLLALGLALAVLARWLSKRAFKERLAKGHGTHTRQFARGAVVGTTALMVVFAWSLSWSFPEATRFGLRNGIQIVPELGAIVAALSIYFGSYAAENVRAGLNSVAKGQREAAAALGLRFGQTMRLITLPLALRVIIPPLTSVYLTLVKGSALGAAIAYPELVQIANTTLNQTGQALEVAAVIIAAYLSLNILIALIMNQIERKSRLVQR